ncbi:hypothetical protein [Undibacterium flavidum]|uniref:O-antigen/teichoic acid export membrane protein n=1 Tax=Undibacterium flavidum TaxID=2762297 RepID=A0ABR6YFL8_9BURK|nr:hypothetical protein [Undibacterium flavidum]MBC3875332.1 hypothetical protein [Undibacterium flavidum]
MKNILNIWMQPVYARLNMESRKSLILVMAFFLLAGQLIASSLYFWSAKKPDVDIFGYAFLFSIAALIVIVFFTWYVMLAQNIGLQYSPANARLVPAIRRHLQIAIIIPILFCALLAGLAGRLIVHEFSVWPMFVCVAVMVFFTIIVRTQWAVVPLVLCFQVPAIMQRAGIEHFDKYLERSLGISFSVLLLLAIPVIIYAGIYWIFSIRDEALFNMHKRTLALRAGIAGTRINENRVSLSLATVFLVWMKHCVVRGLREPGSVQTLKRLHGFVFGPRVHWTTICLQVLAMLALGIFSVFLLDTFSIKKDHDFLTGFSFGFGGVLLVAQPLFFTFLLFYTMYQTRYEQALLQLVPNHVGNAALDQMLMRYLLRQFFILYGLSVLVSVPVCIFVLHGGLQAASLVLFLSCLFPLVSAVVFNYAKMKALNDHPMLKIVIICLLIFVVGMTLGLTTSLTLIWWYSAAVLCATLIWLRKTMKMNASAIMFPTGRSV